MNYRNLANAHLKNAKKELGTNSDLRLKYAALELRMSMEALTYDRAIAYKDEFPPSEYETWQPRKIMSVLLDIDPAADKDCSIAAGLKEEYGVPASKMNWLGSEVVLSMKVLKKHYDALGSYLHIQSMKQSRAGVITDYRKIRDRCKEIYAFIEKVISSPVFNCTIGSFATMKCMECGKPVRKRIPHGQTEVNAICYQCKASYTITDEGEAKVKWTPHNHEIECANPNCQHKIFVWQHEFEIGRHWYCNECKGENRFVLAIQHNQAPTTASTRTLFSLAALATNAPVKLAVMAKIGTTSSIVAEEVIK